MSSSTEARGRTAAGPRVGILRGLVASDTPFVPSGHTALPTTAPVMSTQDVRREAEEAGYADGYAAGLADAERATGQQAADFAAAASSALGALQAAAAELRDRQAVGLVQVADQAAALALDIARSVLQREVAASEDPGREAIARAIGLAPDEGPMVVRLHPDDRARLGQIDDLIAARDVTIQTDPSVEPGGCVLQVQATRVDAQLSTALDRVGEVLR
jgi:flagellar assembly protein FliH